MTSHAIDRADIADLRTRVRGAVHRPSDDGYETIGFNVAVSRRPWAVVDAADAADIAAVMTFAGDNGMTVAVHSTGHGAIPIDGRSLLVRTGGLDTLEIDPAGRTARVGAGVRWQRVLDESAPHGLAPLCGSAPSVGVIGFLTGGGIGPLVRTVGSSSDHVRSFEVVTGAGRVVRASHDENAELFWGLRGGKATLGLVTEAVIDLLPIPELYAGAMYFDGADAPAVLREWRTWSASLPVEANTSVALLRLPELPTVPPMLAGRMTVAVRYAALTSRDEAQRLFAPIRAVAPPLLDAVGTMPYAAIGAIHADPADPMPVAEDGCLLRELPEEAVDAILASAGPDVESPLLMVELRLLGGRFARTPQVDSALCHRSAPLHLYTVGILAPPIAEQVPVAVAGLVETMSAYSDGYRLPNFTATSDAGVTARCYDEQTRAWLRALAGQHDPRGVLRVGQLAR
ncbi:MULTISPECIES: FAD-binding oxidoreductase [Gordonia]|uniref:FAD-binding oxidoreductase n=1 Tax=Gordonia cholesterolivorans TaxID=559625 RepID=A0ABP5UYP5_9ACTN